MTQPSTRVGTYLLWLVLAVSIPLLLFSGYAVWRVQAARAQQREVALAGWVREASAQIDRKLDLLRTGLTALADSPALQRGDLADFAARMNLMTDRLGVASIVLMDPAGRPLLRTGSLNQDQDNALVREAIVAIQQDKPSISNLLGPQGSPKRQVAVTIPAFRADAAAAGYALIGLIDTDRLLVPADLPAPAPDGVVLTLRDRLGATLARYPPDDGTTGQPPPPGFFAAIGQRRSGQLGPAVQLDGSPAMAAFTTLNSSHYTATADVPPGESAVLARRELGEIGLIGSLAVVAGLLGAVAIGRRLSHALRAVEHTSRDTAPSGLREVDELSERLRGLAIQRNEAEATLRQSELQLRDLVATLDLAAIMAREIGGKIRFWSHGCQRMYGWTREEAVGQISHVLLRTQFPTSLPRIEHALLTRGEWKGDLVHRRRDGSMLVVAAHKALRRDSAGRPYMVMESLVDVTELREAQDSLRVLNQALEQRVKAEVAAREDVQRRVAHTERIQALGQLAGGIAHDFNNVLQAVAGGAALIARRPHDAEAVTRLIEVVADAAARGASITRRMLVLARRGDLRAEPVDAASVLQGMREVFMHTLGSAIDITVEVAPGLPKMLADKPQLETALVNLGTNARDAMPEGGTLRLIAAADAIPPSALPHPAGLSVGVYIRLSVADDGTGMTNVTLARAGEPFFTTKDVGKGTGLGLSLVKGYAEQSGGGFMIESRIGAGTIATLWLPVVPGYRGMEPGQVPTPAPTLATGRILLVDDDPLVRDTLREQLEALGHKVLAASGGTDALAILRAREAVDLMITDLSMPGMNGLTLIQKAHDLRPTLPAILLTGYSGDTAGLESSGVARDTYTLIRKPATSAQLNEKVAALLEHP